MAQLNLSGGEGGFAWQISGFESDFTTSNYRRAGVASSPVSSGATSISGILGYKNAGSSGDDTTGTWGWVDYDPGTYTFYGFAQVASDGKYYPAGSARVTVELGPPTAYFTIRSYDSNSISIRIYIDSNYPYYRIYCRKTSQESGQWYPSSSYTERTSRWDYTISGLDPDTSYTINVQCATSSSGANNTYLGAQTQKTDEIAVENWSWTSSNGSATAAQTRNAYTAITSNGKTTDFSYLVWNDMCDKVKEILDAFGYSWSSSYASLASTKMTSTDKKMTAVRFNSLRYNIYSHYTFSLTTATQWAKIYGSYFTTMTTAMNNWIARGY